MKNWISFPLVEGTASRQAHCDLPDGTYEQEMGREGFFGPASQIHHTHAPTGWVEWEGPLRPRAFDLNKVDTPKFSPWDAQLVLFNAATKVRMWRTEGHMPALARNADGDDLLFFHEGAGRFFCDYGHMTFRDGDYIVVPRGVQWRLECDIPAKVLMVEATGDSYKLPNKGIMGSHAIFDPAVLEVPRIDDVFKAQYSEARTSCEIKREDTVSRVTYAFNPLDAIGWHGDMAPVKLNWRDIRPLMSARYHVPPSAHTTFLAGRVIICTFAPRPIESDPGALKLPYFHANVDFDEFIFYHKGQFFSRDNIYPGMTTYHPIGFPHGPHPKAYETAMEYARKETDEVAVMVDARDMLRPAKLPDGVEWTDYYRSWQGKAAAGSEG